MEKKTRKKTPMTHEELKAAKRDWYHKNAEEEREKQRKRYRERQDKAKALRIQKIVQSVGPVIRVPAGHFTY